MARLNEITSTEKLLDLIRNKTGAPLKKKEDTEEVLPGVSPARQKKSTGIFFHTVAVHKPITVGVDIGHEYVRLLTTTKSADGTPALVDQRCLPIPSGLQLDSVEFANFLREQLTSFCGSNKKLQIWAIMSAANVEVRHIRIPRVPKKQLEAVILWTINKETPVKETENVLDYEVLGEVLDQGIAKLAVMYYTAPKQEIEERKKLFSRAGWPLTGLSIPPFAVQNIFRTRWLAASEETVASLFIGNNFSRIDVYTKGSLVMTRGIKAGINSMVESLLEGYNEKTALKGSGNNTFTMDESKARDILFSLSPDSPSLTDDNRAGLQESEIWAMILPAIERLVRQVERTFEYFTANLGNERIGKIYVSGAMNVYRPITEYVGAQLGMASDTFDPLSAQLDCQYVDEQKSFSCISERVAFAPVLGIALSDNKYTPNLLFTYKDKAREASVKHINMAIFFVFMFAVSICAGIFLYQQHAIGKKETIVNQLNQELSRFKPQVDRDVMMKSVAAVRQDIASAKMYGQRYQSLAIIAELANLIAPEIRLVNIRAKLGITPEKSKDISQEKTAAPAKKTDDIKEVEIEGFVSGDKNSFDTTLGNYALMLDNSPLFKDIKIQKAGVEYFRKTALLRFTITMKVEGI